MIAPAHPVILIAAVLFAQSPVAVTSDDRPHFPGDLIPRCAYGDVVCMRDLLQQIFDHHLDGVPEIGVPALNPLDIGQFTINQGDGGGSSPVAVHITMSKVKLFGWDRLQVLRVAGFGKDPRKSKFQIDVYVPIEHMIGRYKLTGKMLLLPLNGHGAANVTINDVRMNVTLRTAVVERSGEDYLQIKGSNMLVDMSGMHMSFDNLLNDATLSDGVNAMLNENQHLLINELRVAMGRAFERPVVRIAGPLFERFPYREFFATDDVVVNDTNGNAPTAREGD